MLSMISSEGEKGEEEGKNKLSIHMSGDSEEIDKVVFIRDPDLVTK